jgi:exodeoxyribonuclease VII small subunit
MADAPDTTELPAEIAALSFEEALGELEAIVQQLERGDRALEEAIEAYARGAQLKRHCENKLRQAQARVEQISLAADGTPQAKPADIA